MTYAYAEVQYDTMAGSISYEITCSCGRDFWGSNTIQTCPSCGKSWEVVVSVVEVE